MSGTVYRAASKPGLTVIRSKVSDMAEAVKADRTSYIGGSDAGAIFGLNPWKSKYALWCEKTGQISGEVEDSDAMMTGRDLEQYVAERFERETGKKVRRDNYKYTLEEYPFMVGHIDRSVIGENAILECKTANSFQDSNYQKGIFPDHYYVQCQHYMAVTGCERVYLGILCFPHFYWTYYDRDDGEIATILEAEKSFWELVENDTPPDTDGSDSTTEALSEQYKEVYPEEVIHLSKSSGADASLIMIEEVKKQIKDLKEIQTEHENKLKSLLGNSGNGYTEDWNISWKEQSRKTVDTDLLKKEYPDIYQECLKSSTSRVLRIRKRKKGK